MPLIEVSELTRTFRVRGRTDVEAVKQLTFEIEAGEMVGYIGPNGAGKSTTIKMLTGILVPTSGSIRVAGRRPEPQAHPAGPPDRRGLRPADDAVVGPAAARLLRPAAEDLQDRPRAAPSQPRRVRRAARPRRPARHPGPPAQPRPADARRHHGGPAARPGDPLPRRAHHRPRRGQQGPAARVPAHPQRRARDHPAAHHPRPPGHRGALPAGDRHRPRHRGVRRDAGRAAPAGRVQRAPWWSTWSTRRRRSPSRGPRPAGSRDRASGSASRPTPRPRRSWPPWWRRTTSRTCPCRSRTSRT